MSDELPASANEERTEFIPTRASLLSRLKDGAADEGWREFFEIYWKLIYNTARRSGLADQECQDVVQETLMSVSRHMPSFSYDPARGSFKSWLMTVTLSRIRDHVRKRPPRQESIEFLEGELPAHDEFEKLWNQDWEKNLTQVALERVKQRVDPVNFQIFSTSVLQDKGARGTAKLLGVGLGRVYMVNHRLGKMLAREIKELKKDPSCSK